MPEGVPHIIVRGHQLLFQKKIYPCAIGKAGFSANKREGDGCTPLGNFALRACWYRADRLAAPQTCLPLRVIHTNDGWCDDPTNPDYNRHVTLPFAASHERLWREEMVYDLIIPLGYNDDPPIPGKGSAIFLHVARDGYPSTEGCVALAKRDLLALLPFFTVESRMEIVGM